MVLLRSDSSTSHWAIPPEAALIDHDEIKQQRRLRHLSAVLIRNLTVDTRRESVSTCLLHSPSLGDSSLLGPVPAVPWPSSSSSFALPSSSSSSPSRPPFASDDLDLLPRNKRRRAGSSASLLARSSALANEMVIPASAELASEGVSSSGVGGAAATASSASSMRPVRTRTRRSLSGGVTMRIQEETEPPSPTVAPLPADAAEATGSLDLDNGPAADDEGGDPSTEPSTSIPTFLRRDRSSSRASIASAATTASGSTIRARADLDAFVAGQISNSASTNFLPPRRLPGDNISSMPRSGRASYASDAQLAKEKQRRAELLHRRLVDSCITLSLVRSNPPPADSLPNSDGDGRRRTNSNASTLRHRLPRSESNSSLPGRSRNRAFSAGPASTDVGASSEILPPFFVARPNHKTMHPTFMVDRNKFLVGEPGQDSDDWPGLQEERLLVSVWTRRGVGASPSETGKSKEINDEEEEWKLLVEWDVNLDGLVSLGRDPTQFPRLQPNTIIFGLGDEYFTAPLPLRSRFRRFASHDDDVSSCSEDDSDGGGNLSDPGAGGLALTLRSRRRRRREEDGAEEARRMRKVLVERSLRETRMVKVASIDTLVEFKKHEHERIALTSSLAETKRRVNDVVSDPEGEVTLGRESEELRDQVEDLEAVRDDVKLDLADIRGELDVKRQALRARRNRLATARSLIDMSRAELVEESRLLRQNEETCSNIRRASHTRRTQLITLLSHIFPIEPVPTDASSLLFSILSIPLPNSSYPPHASDDLLSSALGYAAQVVSALSAYLGVPLHYPIKCLGSRSAVVDLISMMRGPRAFPLYGKGVDRYRFDYGVFLLNKNIEQLMYSQGLTVIDLRNTLPNLKALILALSYDPSHSDFTSSTLKTPDPFQDSLDLASTPPDESHGELAEELEAAAGSHTKGTGNGSAAPPISGDANDADEDDVDSGDDSRSVETMRPTPSKRSTPPSSIIGSVPAPTKSKRNGKTLPPTHEKISPPTARVLGPALALTESTTTTTTTVSGTIKGKAAKGTTSGKSREGSATRALRNSLWTAVGYGPSAE